MERSGHIILAAMLAMLAGAASAAEKGQIIRAGDLFAQPFIDAASAAKLTASQPVTIIERRGAWANVQASGKAGWVRLLNVRLEPASAGPLRPANSKSSSGNVLSLFQSGSSGQTVTTGVKGMDEEQIRASVPNYAELAMLGTLAVDGNSARAAAVTRKLAERPVDYLDKKDGKK